MKTYNLINLPFIMGCFVVIALLFLVPLFGQESQPTGKLGLPLGTFAVIDGTENQTGMREGSDDFFVDTINGKNPGHEVKIRTEWSSSLPDKRIVGKRYVLHGYEVGGWYGTPVSLPQHDQKVGFNFEHSFVVTSVERVDGITVADARPLDPKVPLVEPKYNVKPADGWTRLGLPMGTVAVVEVHSPTKPLLMESPFQIDSVNGKLMDHVSYITIPGLAETKTGQRITLRGYETGAWGSTPCLPTSEYSGPMPQAGFQFFAKFVIVPDVVSTPSPR